MRWTVAEIAAATAGEVAASSGSASGRAAGGTVAAGDAVVEGVGVDSRRLVAGSLFVAIRAERDGHAFVGAAVDAGAAAVLVDRRWTVPGDLAVPAVCVEDTARALLGLGAAARARLAGEVVGVTGSVGKTSTKDMASAALATSLRTWSSERSFNNDLGVPLTLANTPDGVEVAVVEMGTRGRGDIRRLCTVARPTIGVVTAVTAAHTELLGDLDHVAEAKRELVESLPDSGTAILNADDPRVAAMARHTAAEALLFSAEGSPAADVVAGDITLDSELRPSFAVRTPWGKTRARLVARGAHQVPNALAALAVAGACGVPVVAAAESLSHAELSPWRMELLRSPAGAVVLNDAYNANPASMAAALTALAQLPAQRRIAVVGEMAELGERSAADHRAVADLAGRLGVELIAVGTRAYGVPPLDGVDAAAAALSGLGVGDAVLVKASRVAGLERLAALLAAG